MIWIIQAIFGKNKYEKLKKIPQKCFRAFIWIFYQDDINDLSKAAEIGQTPQRTKIIESIRKLGYFASSSVFSPLGVKTDATDEVRILAVKLAQSL